jgi:hypothetical protein
MSQTPPTNAARTREINEMTRYAMWSVFRTDPARLPEDRAAAGEELAGVAGGGVAHVGAERGGGLQVALGRRRGERAEDARRVDDDRQAGGDEGLVGGIAGAVVGAVAAELGAKIVGEAGD